MTSRCADDRPEGSWLGASVGEPRDGFIDLHAKIPVGTVTTLVITSNPAKPEAYQPLPPNSPDTKGEEP